MYTVTAHKVAEATQAAAYAPWSVKAKRAGRELKPLKSLRGFDRAIGRRIGTETYTDPPRWVVHVVGPDLDVWCRCVLSMSMSRGLSFFSSTERIDDVVLVDDATPGDAALVTDAGATA
jgi:hypothetical protein